MTATRARRGRVSRRARSPEKRTPQAVAPIFCDNWWRHLVAHRSRSLFALFPVVYIVSAAFNPDPSLTAPS